MRVVVVALLVMGAAWLMAVAPTSDPAPPVVTQHKIKECRDLCEQTAIVDQLGESYLHNCRARCDGPPRPREPIQRITVAPADHSKSLPNRP